MKTSRRRIWSGILLVVLLWGGIFAFLMHHLGHLAEDNAKDALALRLIDSIDILRKTARDQQLAQDAFREAALAKCRAIALGLETPNAIAATAEEKMAFLNRLIKKWNIHGYSIADQSGIIRLSSEPGDIGFDMHSGAQSKEFLPAITDRDFAIVQPPQPRSFDGRISQYVGVARRDEPGIVQISYLVEKRDALMSIVSLQRRMQSMRIGKHGFIVAVQNHTIVAAENEALIGIKIPEVALAEGAEVGNFFTVELAGERYMAAFEPIGDLLLVGLLPYSEIHAIINDCILAVATALLFGLLGLILVFRSGGIKAQ